MFKNLLRIAVFALPLVAAIAVKESSVKEGPLPDCMWKDCANKAVPTILIPQN